MDDYIVVTLVGALAIALLSMIGLIIYLIYLKGGFLLILGAIAVVVFCNLVGRLVIGLLFS